MSRIPPNLLYLTIYNPTLKPPGPVLYDDEDAEEQAHILFYTSKERAVSRDRMLRQVGLAKALVNFSSIFNGVDICNNVHSQSKRLIMVSPEPNFWIHASVELAKVPRAPLEKGKGKSKDKLKSSERGKEKGLGNTLLYDYQEGSVHDLVLRAAILRGYEQFKLTHGSFTTILSTIGQEGLELQLERFFTVWAWSWNLEEGAEFGEHLGISLHPSYRSLAPIITDFSQHLPDQVSSVIIQPPYLIPSPQYFAANHPISLPRYLLSLIPEAPVSEATSHDETMLGERPFDGAASNGKNPSREPSTSSFLGMPAMNMNVKWGWPAALTFGKGSDRRQGSVSKERLEEKETPTARENRPCDTFLPSTVTQGLDHGALADAISEDMSSSVSTSSITDEHSIPPLLDMKIQPSILPPSEASEQVEDILSVDADASHYHRSAGNVDLIMTTSPLNTADPAVLSPPPPVFSSLDIHLATLDSPHLTTGHKIYYIINDGTMLALIGLDDELSTSLTELAQSTITLLLDIESVFSEELSKTLTPDQLPTLSKILQPTDIHIMSMRQFTIPSPNFMSKSSYLYDAEELQSLDPDILEVFSRGLNPQHWHIARRGLGQSSTDEYGVPSGEQVYMQIFRKEASLSDVDNVLAGVVKRNGLSDSTA
ncbi:Vacuolar fusion protein CCZ1 like protein [Termitomyces sp. T112]|nr:Vacuolar fusion protein CCZ1 like protein [Termitomyces sp. T112]